ncbi:MAG: hypothetical protein HY293_12710 [Planctomycetes bacterium]|nr:hypothetical protein [Planctomycetota bacterium]
MGPKKKRASPWPLLGLSLLLLLAPSSLSQKTRLTALAGFIPFQGLGRWASHLPGLVSRPSGDVQELATKLEFQEAQNRKLDQENKRLALQLEQALGSPPARARAS